MAISPHSFRCFFAVDGASGGLGKRTRWETREQKGEEQEKGQDTQESTLADRDKLMGVLWNPHRLFRAATPHAGQGKTRNSESWCFCPQGARSTERAGGWGEGEPEANEERKEENCTCMLFGELSQAKGTQVRTDERRKGKARTSRAQQLKTAPFDLGDVISQQKRKRRGNREQLVDKRWGTEVRQRGQSTTQGIWGVAGRKRRQAYRQGGTRAAMFS